ncbi:hypothetical protein EO98_01740 [Methanosarcina sp. 2.H.T.1A.6]|uniref:hypothetical protein n=1 Tax=unclassified Methanosarcina TaxID=2644672 RepID=UPI0006223F9C|nr:MULTISPECIES: hypothetical protein [unclassified Methanosarcina]KKG18252.1 hypothetical protein EO94_07920 [Methanosarcina sp. 2.H.T.1A.3]KKG21111.1 hypothetical protein EO98_01740 [Methanosarcina sp. 2.H.T.1A.6]KKG21620.1 hypothetical protein EO97_02500 [Methanosarcina sp. 2.H.T.1A.15]KKG23857.1 hypothetical protein EO96_07450 [Methanosarcina sp. 2.H.T.1A.8]
MIFNFTFYGFIATLCIAYAQLFNEEDDLVNINMKNVLKQSTRFSYSDIKNVCQIFIDIFDKYYSDTFKHPAFSNFLWVSIFIYWGIVFLFSIFGATDKYVNTIQVLSISLVFGSLMAILSTFGGSIGFKESIPTLDNLYDQLTYFIKHKLKLKNKPYSEYRNEKISLKKCVFASMCWAMSFGIFFLTMGIIIQLAPESLITSSGFPDIPIFHLGYTEFIKFYGLISLIIVAVFFFPAAYMYIVFSAMEKYKSFFKISPLIVIISSFITIVLCSVFKYNLILPLLKENRFFLYNFVPFFFLNVLADSLSILETRYMLNKAISGSKGTLVLFIFLDLLTSSLIYLLVPMLNGDLTIFLDAITFNGKMAWVGIFYWSSLFTSILFYLYVSGFFILHILCKCSNNKYFVNKPNKWLGIILFLIVTTVYLIPTRFEFVLPTLLIIIILMLLSLVIMIKSKKLNFNS